MSPDQPHPEPGHQEVKAAVPAIDNDHLPSGEALRKELEQQVWSSSKEYAKQGKLSSSTFRESTDSTWEQEPVEAGGRSFVTHYQEGYLLRTDPGTDTPPYHVRESASLRISEYTDGVLTSNYFFDGRMDGALDRAYTYDIGDEGDKRGSRALEPEELIFLQKTFADLTKKASAQPDDEDLSDTQP